MVLLSVRNGLVVSPQDSMIQRSSLRGVALALALLSGLATGCSRMPWSRNGADNLQVVAADGVLCDLTRTLATAAVTVNCILSGEDDPHTFSLEPEQRADLERADLVLINGLNLTPVLSPFAAEGKVVAVAEAIELPTLDPMADDHEGRKDHDHHGSRNGDHEDHHDEDHHGEHGSHDEEHEGHDEHDHHGHDHGGVDPHVWHNPMNTRAMAMVITRELIQLAPEETSGLRKLNQEATAVLNDLDEWTRRQVEAIPPQQRVLATRHKAFGYYAQRYGFRELPLLDSFDSGEALRPAALSGLLQKLEEANVAALFPEQNPPNKSLEVIARQSGIPLSRQHLTSDGLAPGKSTVETFVTNTCAVRRGLQGQCDEAEGEDLVNRWHTLSDHASTSGEG